MNAQEIAAKTELNYEDSWNAFKFLKKNIMKKSELKQIIREEIENTLNEDAVSMPLGAPGSKAKVTIKQTSLIGDVSIEVLNDAGKVQVIDVLEDHIPYIIQALNSFSKK